MGHDLGPLQQPSGVAVDEGGCVLVADTGARRIVVFRGDGSSLGAWPTPAPPLSITVLSDGRIAAGLGDGTVAVW